MNTDLLIPVLSCGAVALFAHFVSSLVMTRSDDRIMDRLRDGQEDLDGTVDGAMRPSGLKPLLERMGQAAAQPFMPKSREKQSGMRTQLSRAGIYSPQAIRMLKAAFNLLDDGLVGQQIFAGEATRLAYMTDEAVEGRDAFLEKRDPDWSAFPRYF